MNSSNKYKEKIIEDISILFITSFLYYIFICGKLYLYGIHVKNININPYYSFIYAFIFLILINVPKLIQLRIEKLVTNKIRNKKNINDNKSTILYCLNEIVFSSYLSFKILKFNLFCRIFYYAFWVTI